MDVLTICAAACVSCKGAVGAGAVSAGLVVACPLDTAEVASPNSEGGSYRAMREYESGHESMLSLGHLSRPVYNDSPQVPHESWSSSSPSTRTQNPSAQAIRLQLTLALPSR